MTQLVCGGPGPHIPASGILGTTSADVPPDVRCSAAVCQVPADPTIANGQTIVQAAANALLSNRTYLAIATPTNAQVAAQVRALTQQVQGLIRLAIGDLSGTT